ncbi:hypothetical protein DSO57_1018708, partial [Entomophthora muscae]
VGQVDPPLGLDDLETRVGFGIRWLQVLLAGNRLNASRTAALTPQVWQSKATCCRVDENKTGFGIGIIKVHWYNHADH